MINNNLTEKQFVLKHYPDAYCKMISGMMGKWFYIYLYKSSSMEFVCSTSSAQHAWTTAKRRIEDKYAQSEDTKLKKWVKQRGILLKNWNNFSDYEKLPFYLEFIKHQKFFPPEVNYISIPIDINETITYLENIIRKIEFDPRF